MESISKSQAGKLAVLSCLHRPGPGNGKQATLETVRHLGYVQIDTISVIERAHHHVFWSRQSSYQADYLDALLAEDRAVFEHWAHAVAYLPMEDFRYYLPKMEPYREPPTGKRWKEQYETAKPHFKNILRRIREEGPLASKDFDHDRRSSPGWWEWKPAKRALEFLYLRGDLMVTARRNFHRLYDLTERVLPDQLDTTMPMAEECAALQIRRALQAFGLAREREIAQYLKIAGRKVIQAVLREWVASGKLQTVRVRGIEGEVYYTTPGCLEKILSRRIPKSVHILSPFDNLVIQRDRMKLLFDFDYTIECYVPAAKRKYGYFVCPVLWGHELVARIDLKADRKTKKLRVQNLHYEPGLKNKEAFDQALHAALRRFAGFNGCSSLHP